MRAAEKIGNLEKRIVVLETFVQDHYLSKECLEEAKLCLKWARLDAKDQGILCDLACSNSLSKVCRIKDISDKEIRRKLLTNFVNKEDLDQREREEAWMTLVKDETLTFAERRDVVSLIGSNDNKDKAWIVLVTDRTLTGTERTHAASAIVADDKKDEAWMTLVKDETLTFVERRDIIISAIGSNDNKDKAWVVLVTDKTLPGAERTHAASAIVADDK